MKAQGNERGQALVLIVLAIIALFGFAALAVDGGRVYSERRRAQNAADSAAYAAAMAAIQEQDYIQAALEQAEFNDYQGADVQVNHPPVRGSYAGDEDYYEVIITTQVDPAFAQIVTDQPLQVEAYAVAHARPIEAVSSGNVIHALDDQGVGLEFKGNVQLEVNGGNIYSNAGINNKGESGYMHANDGEIYYSNDICDNCDSPNFSPSPEKSDGAIYLAGLPDPSCPSTPGSQTGSRMTPGTFANTVRINGNVDIVMEPGIYCFDNGLTINGGASVVGRDVLLVLRGGDIDLTGAGKVRLTRADDLKDAAGNQWGGMLLYALPKVRGPVHLSGTSGTQFSGTIYGPNSWCIFAGNDTTLGFNSNIVCKEILFNGNPKITVNYKEPQNFQLPPILELSQ